MNTAELQNTATKMKLAMIFQLFTALLATIIHAQPVRVEINVNETAYAVLNRVMGKNVEVPDCGHPEFNDHITHVLDDELGRRVFAFHGHPNEDNDRCINYDRMRIEIDMGPSSPEYQKLLENDTGIYSWNFKLKKGIQMSPEFTHIHQQKSSGGNDSMPIYTLSLEKNYLGQRKMRLVYWPWNERQARRDLVEVPVEPFEDTWVHVYERITMAHQEGSSLKSRA